MVNGMMKIEIANKGKKMKITKKYIAEKTEVTRKWFDQYFYSA